MRSYEDLEVELTNELNKLHDIYIKNWIPAKPEDSPEAFQYDVKSYCILAHAAFEEFIEIVSQEISMKIEKAWQSKKYSRSLIVFTTHYCNAKLAIEENESTPQSLIFDQIRALIKQGANTHSNAIFNNHGFSLKYLRAILTPVGIDIPNDLNLMNSLNELARARGSYAHKVTENAAIPKAKKPMTPESAYNIVKDCLNLCVKIKILADAELSSMKEKTTIPLRSRSKMLALKAKNNR